MESTKEPNFYASCKFRHHYSRLERQEKVKERIKGFLMAAEKFSVPVIDLANYLPAEKEKLAAAVTELGCFRVINHGIPASLVTEIRATVRSLLEIPKEVKLRSTEDIITGTGYIGINDQRVNMTQFLESFGIYNAASSEDVHAFCSLMNVSPGLREIISTYTSKLHSLIVDIASKMSDCLGVVGFSFQEWPCFLRLNYYKFTQEAIGSIGAVAHSDSSFLTIIHEYENVGGLEIIGPTENFVSIDPVSGTFFFIIGDMGKVWSNGRLHNVRHRIVCTEGLERFSNVFFMLAPKDYMIKPQAEFIDSEHPKLYGTIDVKEYRRLRRSSKSLTGQLLPLLPIDRATMYK